MATAIDQGCKSNSWLSSNVKSANSFWPVELVSTDAHQIDIGLIDVDWYFSDGLSSVSVEKYSLLPAKLTDLVDILNHTDLVVYIHRAYT